MHGIDGGPLDKRSEAAKPVAYPTQLKHVLPQPNNRLILAPHKQEAIII